MLTIDETAELMDRLKRLKAAAQAAIGDCFEPELRLVCNAKLAEAYTVLIHFRSPGGQIDLQPPVLRVYGGCQLTAIEAAFGEVRRRFEQAEAQRAEARKLLSGAAEGAA